ncbi:hypothetical protein HR09_03990 [Porphyromonas gulae]|uniref:DUF3945 domain-containing protein n=1 Tax=Bacteroidales TaxID=171549 RepID=UPI00052D9310|nr:MULTISPECIES: DUF3945 domain-containing protein [Bacteroidales]KGN69842.1 hypothetical protein HR09_03990 [Porphyromonas gulae]MBB3894382.1 hypothetical protein [Bacteroides pyogenes]SUV35541.1 Copper amine oxidase domain-containing protein [Bacteroides pyogenes]
MDVNSNNKSGSDEQMMDILLVFDKEKKTINAVKGIDENGELQTVPPKQEHNNDFLKVDKQGNALENFLKNFFNQLKDPTRFSFFKVAPEDTERTVKIIQENIKNPTPAADEMLDEIRIEPKEPKPEVSKESTTQEQKPADTNKYFIDPNKINWDDLKNLGITKEQLEKSKALEPMLRGYKSPSTFPIEANFGSMVMKTDARLSFRPDSEGNVVLAIHGIRKEPELDRPFFGHQFTDEDKKNLRETGNMGRIVDVKNYRTGELVPSFISIDKQTNELVSMKASSLKLPDEIKGVKLDEKQKAALMEGKAVFLENMISAKNKPFSAFVQVNAEKRSLEFIFPEKEQKQTQQQGQQQRNDQPEGVRIPKSLAGVELSDKQQADLRADKTIYVKGLKDKEGQEYNAYVKVNHEKGKLDFYKFNPDKAKEKAKEITPANEHKTQVAVNSEGKTNEATKHTKEPLKPGQATPTGEQKKKREEKKEEQKPDKPKKSQGRKMK